MVNNKPFCSIALCFNYLSNHKYGITYLMTKVKNSAMPTHCLFSYSILRNVNGYINFHA